MAGGQRDLCQGVRWKLQASWGKRGGEAQACFESAVAAITRLASRSAFTENAVQALGSLLVGSMKLRMPCRASAL